jgi:hypothetical protein
MTKKNATSLTLGGLHALPGQILDDNPRRDGMRVKILAPKGHLQYGIDGVIISALDDNFVRLVLTASEPIPVSTIDEVER